MAIGVIVGYVLGGVLGPAMAPLTEFLEHTFRRIWQTAIPEPVSLIEMRWRHELTSDDYFINMASLGYHREWAEKLYLAAERFLSAEEYLRAKWRGLISEDEYKEAMTKLHISEKTRERFERVSEYFPPPPDLIRFAVREVYTPEVIEEYKMMEDLPPKFLEEARKAGLPEEQAKNYWAAHWVLPSVEMGYEMLHRGVISMDDLKTLMRTLDIMPFWREPLIKISYRPFTRVDVRRMYQAGVLGRDEVKRAYLDLGYDEEKAEKMTEFTVRWVEEKPRELSLAKVEKAFKEDKITMDEARRMIMDLGYSREDTDLLLAIWADDKAEADLQEEIDTLYELFLAGEISETEFADKLDALNLPAATRMRITRRAYRAKMALVRLPTRTDVTRWFKKNVITIEEWRMLMSMLHYPQWAIENYEAEMSS